MRRTQLTGLILWRGGLILVASYGLYRWARWVLDLIEILPRQLEVGVGLMIAGLAMVLLSVIAERIDDYRREKEDPS